MIARLLKLNNPEKGLAISLTVLSLDLFNSRSNNVRTCALGAADST